jgi:hypothetical protein
MFRRSLLARYVEKTATIIITCDEGTSVWRPAPADDLGDGTFRILGAVPVEEIWMFKPGEIVRCRRQLFSEGQEGLAAYELA